MTGIDPRARLIEGLPLRPGWRVLDAGYGTGVLLPALAAAVAPADGTTPVAPGAITGIDLEPVLDDRLDPRARELVDAGIAVLRRADVTALPDANATYDAAWMAAVLHHVADPAAAVRELARVVRPGGIVAIHDGDEGGSFPFMPWPPALETALRSASARAAADGYGGRLPYTFHPLIARDVPRLMRLAGLTSVRITPTVETDGPPIPPGRADAIRRWLTGPFLERVGPYLAPVDREALDALVGPSAAVGAGQDDGWLTGPDTFLVRTSLLVTGHRPT